MTPQGKRDLFRIAVTMILVLIMAVSCVALIQHVEQPGPRDLELIRDE